MLIFSDRKATFLPTSASFLFPVTLSQDTPMSASQNPSQKGLQGSELHPLEFHSCSGLPPLDSLSGSYHSMKRYTAFPSTLLWVSVAGIPLTRRRTTQQSTCSPHTLGGARSSDPPPHTHCPRLLESLGLGLPLAAKWRHCTAPGANSRHRPGIGSFYSRGVAI